MKLKATEIALYTLIVVMIFFILGNYKYQPTLSAEEKEAVEELNQIKANQESFVAKNSSNHTFGEIDLSHYNVNSGYSELLLLIQDLLQLDVISGYYNDETKQALIELQEKHDLEVTGKVDELTFSKIMEETLPLSADELRNHGYLVRLLQRQINLADDGILGDVTIQSIKQLQADLNQDEKTIEDTILVDDTVITYVIEHLNS